VEILVSGVNVLLESYIRETENVLVIFSYLAGHILLLICLVVYIFKIHRKSWMSLRYCHRMVIAYCLKKHIGSKMPNT